MSYACLLINENGACAAAESRLSISTVLDPLFPRMHLHHDHETKVFSSREDRLIWAFTGVTTRGPMHFPTMVRLIMQNDSVPLEQRLHIVKKKLCRYTRQIPLVLKLQLLIHRGRTADDASCSFVYNLMYAYFDKDGKPCLGSLSVKNGKVLYDHHYRGSLFIENGRNMASLSPKRGFVPHRNDGPEELQRKAIQRVQESIDKDVELKSLDPGYRITIGGRIRSVVLLPPEKKPSGHERTSPNIAT